MSCTACHGDPARLPEGEQLTDAAPPLDAQGLGSSAEVGTHQSHLFGSATSPLSDGVACTACHAVPTGFAHVNGVAAVALKTPTGTASGTYSRPGAAAGTCSSTYCHGNFTGGATGNSPSWTAAGTQSSCDRCHGNSPGTGKHPSVESNHSWMGTRCQFCHLDVATSGAIKAGGRALHVNGAKDVRLSEDGTTASGTWDSQAKSCSPGCHGSASW